MNSREEGFSEKVTRWFFNLAGVAMLGVAVYLLLKGDSTGGGVAGIIAFGMLAYRFFPLIERIEMFGLKAELRQKIEEADLELTKLREVATALAGASILQLTWAGRWGAPSFATTRSKLEDLERVLSNLQVSPPTIAAVKEPFIQMMCYDLLLVARSTIAEVFRHYASVTSQRTQEYTRGRSIQGDDPEFHRLLNASRQYTLKELRDIDPTADVINGIRNDLMDRVQNAPILEDDRSKLLQLLNEVSTLSHTVTENGKVSPEVARYLEVYGRGANKKFHELFGEHHSKTVASELR